MPRVLLFDQNSVPQLFDTGQDALTQLSENRLAWVHLRSNDDVRSILPDIIDKSRGFTEDLLEEQRPRVALYPTTEDNEDTFSVIVLSMPTHKIFEQDEFQLQVTFILLDNKIYSVGSTEIGIFPEIMAKIQTRKMQHTISTLFKTILSELFEMGIEVMNSVEEFIDHTEGKQLKSNLERGWLASLLTLKSRLFDANKLIKADLEHVREIMEGEVPELDSEEVGDHPEDRLLYSIDYIETLREELSNIINLNIAISNQLMQKQFYVLTILGALLVIPTVISGLFGMNVPLPDLTFWQIILLMTILTIFFGLLIQFLVPRPTLS